MQYKTKTAFTTLKYNGIRPANTEQLHHIISTLAFHITTKSNIKIDSKLGLCSSNCQNGFHFESKKEIPVTAICNSNDCKKAAKVLGVIRRHVQSNGLLIKLSYQVYLVCRFLSAVTVPV